MAIVWPMLCLHYRMKGGMDEAASGWANTLASCSHYEGSEELLVFIRYSQPSLDSTGITGGERAYVP